MKAIARLLWAYFTPTPWISAASAIAVIMASGAFLRWFVTPDAHDGFSLLLPVLAIGAAYVGSVFMPLMAGRIARGHSIHVLPGGRGKLLASVFSTILLVSFVAPFFWALPNWSVTEEAVRRNGVDALTQYHELVMLDALTIYTSGILMTGWLYLSLWFITGERTAAGFVKGLVVLLLALFAPTREIQTLESSLAWNLVWLASLWTVTGVGFLYWPRIRGVVSQFLPRARFSFGNLRTRPVTGREFDLILGTANPWLLSAALIVPAVLAARIGFYSSAVWLFYLTIFSTVSGAIAGQAAERSRTLWLRSRWSREELFGRVERSFWRHNLFVLATLSSLMLIIGRYASLPQSLLAMGLPLLVLGTTTSTYLGLMITRGLGWLESLLGIVLMLALMIVAVLAAGATTDARLVMAFELLLAVVALVLRFAAQARWAGIDWSQCRPERLIARRPG